MPAAAQEESKRKYLWRVGPLVSTKKQLEQQ